MAEEPYVHVPPDIKPEDFEVDRLKTLSYSREASMLFPSDANLIADADLG